MPRPRSIWPFAIYLQPLVAQELNQVGQAAGVAPLVVVPGNDFDEVAQADGVAQKGGSVNLVQTMNDAAFGVKTRFDLREKSAVLLLKMTEDRIGN